MKTTTSLILAAGLLGAGAVAGLADDRNIGAVEQRQQRRIHRGVKEGDLTHREARRLHQGEAHVEEDRREALSDDGRIDRGERRHIRHEQRQLNDQIHHERHDAQER
jgi:hypothetical protein